jgi:hypothetical protein
MAFTASVHLQSFQECIGPYVDYKMEKSVDIVLFSRNDFNVHGWIDGFIENNFSEYELDEDYKDYIGSDYLQSVEVYRYMIDYIHAYREDYLETTEIIDSYECIDVLQDFIYCYCRTKHYNTMLSYISNRANEIRNG